MEQLSAFDRAQRIRALKSLAEAMQASAPASETPNVNMHLHSFFSYNAENYSPSRLALECRRQGLYAAGLCDFDVLDGLEEFLSAGEILQLRTTVNLETRAFLPEYAEVDINSPGEPGVSYVMGAGFDAVPTEGTSQAETLDDLCQRAHKRNLELIERINRKLMNIEIDYEQDVLPRTPGGTATERHIVDAYIQAAEERFPGKGLVGFWGMVFGMEASEVKKFLEDPVKLREAARAKLAKRGGIGYVQPSAETFPKMDTFLKWVSDCRAIPMITWLDGTSRGESDPRAMFECMMEKGAAALNIIPDRNWNISEPDAAALKQQKLQECVQVAEDLNLPINIGTEMNKPGQPFVDDLAGPILSRHADAFLRGAQILVGHTTLLRFANYSYIGPGGPDEYPDVAARNDFFASVGALEPVSRNLAENLRSAGPEKALARIKDAAGKGSWD
jgi:hypothetical protein